MTQLTYTVPELGSTGWGVSLNTILNDIKFTFNGLESSSANKDLSNLSPEGEARISGGSVSYDGVTVNKNSNNELQTIAVKNRRDMSTLPIWHGTQAQWTAGGMVNWCNWATNAIVTQTVNTISLTGSPVLNPGPVVFGNGVYVSRPSSGTYYYSTDGINWTSKSGVRSIYCFGAGKFIGRSGDNFFYSTDGINWTPTSANTYGACCYSDGKFVFYGPRTSGYSIDGVNWVVNTNQNEENYMAVMYGNGVFVAIPNSPTAPIMYSTDGINWNSTNTYFPDYPGYQGGYGQGYFVWPVNSGTSANMGFMYSVDGINWSHFNTPSTSTSAYMYHGAVMFYFSGVFYTTVKLSSSTYFFVIRSLADCIYDNRLYGRTISTSTDFSMGMYATSDKIMLYTSRSQGYYLSYTQLACFTTSETPAIGDSTYSSPGTASQLVVASTTTTGAIALSDNNTYYRNSSGDQQTYATIGDAHPEYLCFIDGVGVKMGNTMIANLTSE